MVSHHAAVLSVMGLTIMGTSRDPESRSRASWQTSRPPSYCTACNEQLSTSNNCCSVVVIVTVLVLVLVLLRVIRPVGSEFRSLFLQKKHSVVLVLVLVLELEIEIVPVPELNSNASCQLLLSR